jgi:transposase
VESVSFDRCCKTLDKGKRWNIQTVSMDMWELYILSTKKYVKDPDSKIVFDKFHMIRQMNEVLDDVRKHENDKMRKNGNDILAGTKYLWLYSAENLPDKQRKRFYALQTMTMKRVRSYSMNEDLREMWNCNKVDETVSFRKKWYFWAARSRLEPIIKKVKMFRNHPAGVMAYGCCNK